MITIDYLGREGGQKKTQKSNYIILEQPQNGIERIEKE